MPMDRSPIRRDGHDHLRDSTDEIETRYSSNPKRVPRTNPSRSTPTTDGMSDEDITRARTDYDTQGIITLEPKATRPRQQNYRAVPARQPSNRLPNVKQPTQQSVPLRQPTQAREVVRRPTQPSALRQPTQPRTGTKRPSQDSSQRQYHWLVPTGITMIIAIACYLLIYGVLITGRGLYNDWTYGASTRTSHLDAVVGDHDSITSPTHFVAMNLHGSIDVIELPGGDVTHAKVFPGPHLLWSNADKAVVTLEVKDVNNDNKPDIIVHIVGDTDLLFRQTNANFVLRNNGSGFAPMIPFQS